jgi:hypothetical protein
MGMITNAIGMAMAIHSEYQKSKLAPPRLGTPHAIPPQARESSHHAPAASLAAPQQQNIQMTKSAAMSAPRTQPPAQIKAPPAMSKSLSR